MYNTTIRIAAKRVQKHMKSLKMEFVMRKVPNIDNLLSCFDECNNFKNCSSLSFNVEDDICSLSSSQIAIDNMNNFLKSTSKVEILIVAYSPMFNKHC